MKMVTYFRILVTMETGGKITLIQYWTWATGWATRVLGFDSRRGLGIFLFTITSRTALGPTHPPIQWVPGALPLGVKRPGREADHSPPSSAEVKNTWSYISTPPIRLHGVVLSQTQWKLYLLQYWTMLRGPLSPRYGASSCCGCMGRPPDIEDSCVYTEYAVADSRQGVVFQIGG
jgi:hypothetical protein